MPDLKRLRGEDRVYVGISVGGEDWNDIRNESHRRRQSMSAFFIGLFYAWCDLNNRPAMIDAPAEAVRAPSAAPNGTKKERRVVLTLSVREWYAIQKYAGRRVQSPSSFLLSLADAHFQKDGAYR